MKLVDALVLVLKEWGVSFVFGVSGANIEHFHDAIFRLGDGELQSVLAKSEVGAAFMADAQARIHRTLGVCCATSGGGMMNLAVGLAESYAESVPVLAIVGQVPSTLEGRGGFQDSSGIGRTVDALALFRSMTKYVARLEGGPGFWEHLYAAAKAALTGRPGPAALLVPRDAYEADVGPRPPWFPATLAALGAPAAVFEGRLNALFETLRGARRPVLLLGTGVARCTDPEAVVRFARKARIPVVSTMGDPGAFPHDDPLFLGIVGAAGHPSAHAYVNDVADVLVAVGTGLDVMTRHPLERGLRRCRVVAVNMDPGEILRSSHPALVVEGDAGLVFRGLLRLRDERPFEAPPLGDYALTRFVPVLEAVEEENAAPASGSGEHPLPGRERGLLRSEAIAVLEPWLPEAGHLLFDAGNCAAAALHALTIPRGVSATIALGMGGMGYAIAGAIGAQIGESAGKRTVVLCGDGAFLMVGFEVHTAVELGLRVLFVVFNNGKHGMCVTRQRLFFEGRIECAAYDPVDVAATSRGFAPADRLWVRKVATRADLGDALAEYDSLVPPRPGVLELSLPREEMPPFAPFLAETAATYVAKAPARRAEPSAA